MTYISTIKTGLLVFPLLAILFTMPYALYQYHKYGSISKFRTLIIYSFILYMLIAYFMVILPLPSRESTIGNRWQDHLNLIPFRQIYLYWKDKEFSLSAIGAYLKSFSFWQLLFNVLLTVPFGIYLRYYFKQSFKRTVLFSFLLSLFYELTQLTALYGIYLGPYRLADVEDLICNTLGGVCGYWVASVFSKILPKREEIDQRCREAGKQITGRRRVWAVLFDYLCCEAVYIVLQGLVNLFVSDSPKFFDYGRTHFWSIFCVFELFQVLLTNGFTIGHAICRMVLVSQDGSMASKGQLIRRYLILWMFTDLPLLLVSWLDGSKFRFIHDFILLILMFVPDMYLVLYFINEVFRKGAVPMPHDTLSKTVYMATEIPENE